MKMTFTRIFQLIILLVFPVFVFAQKDYNVLLHSGKFVPAENISSISNNDAIMQSSFYQDKFYVLIQFRALPDQATKDRLKNKGIELIDYIPNLSYTAAVNKNTDISILKIFPVRSVYRFESIQKTVPALMRNEVPYYAIKQAGYADLFVITYEKMALNKIGSSISALGGSILEDMPSFRTFTVRIPIGNIQHLIGLPFVQWAEPIDPPNQLENLPGRTLHRVNVLNDGVRNLKGDGVNIGIWDSGEIGQHLDFSPAGRVTQVEFNSPAQHSTHCAGTILGKGLINPVARGMAPNANLYSYNFNGNIQSEMAAGIPANNLIVSSHSYGSTQTCGLNGAGVTYSTTSRNTDINLNNFPYHLHVHSAGNSQTACAGGWSTITASGKSAKNNILVANITTAEALSGSSSCGPVQDGRVKPEISAMGTSVFSTSTPANAYATLSGTSMATPGVAGTVALLVQRYQQLNANALPASTLIKNTILNTAHDLGNAGPDYRFGYGRINALEAVKILEDNRYALNTVTTGGQNDVMINVPNGAARLRVMLTWNDPAGAANANPALVNNLDLSVINGATTTLPWILDPNNPGTPAVRGVDVVSNIEQVTIDNPASGSYTLRINGLAVPTGPSQDYALSWSIDMPYIEVTYPNGGEKFSPGFSETITWNNAGVSGNQTVEYSTDNGNSWNTIGTVGATTTRLTWSPPSVSTNIALVRVTSGALSDQSDANFAITGKVTSFSGSGVSCNAGEVIFSWGAASNATHYDIYRFDETTADYVILASDLTGTTYTATGLTPNASMWFAIRAKNNTTSSVSERSNAINVTVSNGGGGLGAVGTINGQTNICGTPVTETYSIASVSGASSYTWTAPPGATVVAGQGTTTVNITYNNGSSSGNVSVFASNGACQTAPNNLAVSVGTTSIAPPTSGGDQLQTVCPPNSLPTLTATATVPPGYSIVWYNAASGGTVVANPIWNTNGSITYYAAIVDNNTGCEGTTRTPVTLTINSVPGASVSAGSATTFCQGGSVVLTANTGDTYLWSNGATSRSITVNASGNYSVMVTTAGCTTTSPVTTVTVNPLPAANINASGATDFCEGGSVQLTASAGNSWMWSNGSSAQSITINSTGTHSVTVTDANGCSNTSSVTSVNVSPSPVVSISASPYTRLYPGLTTSLTANVTPSGSYNYAWFRNGNPVAGGNAATLSGIDLDELGSYTVMVTNTTGLPYSDLSDALVIADSAISKLFILPNPNNGNFEVVYHSSGNNTYTLSIVDGKGAIVYRKAYSISSPYQRMPVDIKKQGGGLFHVVLTNIQGKRIATGKVLIQ